MNTVLPLNPLEKNIRVRVLEALHKYGYKQVDVARETGIHHSTLSLWLQGKIKGHYVKVDETMEEWLQNLYANKPRFIKSNNNKLAQMKNSTSALFNRFNPTKVDPFTINFQSHTTAQPQTVTSPKNNCFEDYIPIRLDMEFEGKRFKENIYWNVEEPFLTPENFAKIMAEENNLPLSFENEIAYTLKRYIANYKPYVPQSSELLKVIELDIRIDNICLKDRFEWDINDPKNNPEEFAYKLCEELGLNNEFAVEIAHSIREQILSYQKQIMDHREDGKMKMIEDLATLKKSTRSLLESSSNFTNLNLKNPPSKVINSENFLRPISHIYKDDTDNLQIWEPHIEILDPSDIRKFQKLEERKNRYVRRIR